MFRFGRPSQVICMNWFRTPVAVSLIAGILAFATRLYGLSDKPLWLDEVITHVRANLPILDLITSSLHNKHFPAYFVLARAFDARIIDEWMLRLPSVIFGTVAVMLVAMVATEIKSPRAGLAAGTLMALAPLDVQLGQEARPYTLASCLVMLALWGLVRIARQSATTFPTSGRSKGERVSWAVYTDRNDWRAKCFISGGVLAHRVEYRHCRHRSSHGSCAVETNSKLGDCADHHRPRLVARTGRNLSSRRAGSLLYPSLDTGVYA